MRRLLSNYRRGFSVGQIVGQIILIGGFLVLFVAGALHAAFAPPPPPLTAEELHHREVSRAQERQLRAIREEQARRNAAENSKALVAWWDKVWNDDGCEYIAHPLGDGSYRLERC